MLRSGPRRPLWVKSGNARNEPMMSAFHPIATKQRTQFYVGLVPTGDILQRAQFRLFDHPIRAHEDRRRDGDAECFGAVQVDDEFKHRGLFDRQLSRFLSL
jgi:hypothetical protein